MPRSQRWRCELCQRPIAAKAGYVELFNANPALGRVGGRPRAPSREFADVEALRFPREPDAPAEARLLSELAPDLHAIENDPLYQPNVRWRAVHGACDDRPDVTGYWLDVGRLLTLSQWVDFVLHVGQKPWMGRRDVLGLLEFWFANRGIKPDVA